LVEGSGKNYPVALLFPDRLAIMDSMNGNRAQTNGCICPNNLHSLSDCLGNCLREINLGLKQKFSRIKVAMLIDDELKVDNSTLTPSLKLAPNNVKTIYRNHIEKLYGSDEQIENVFIIYLDEEENIK
jgi:long-subunit acyl-CoA synthetase (AMP-forming)